MSQPQPRAPNLEPEQLLHGHKQKVYHCADLRDPTVDGHFLSYLTILDYPNSDSALTLLRTLAKITCAAMGRHQIEVPVFAEYNAGSCYPLGQNIITPAKRSDLGQPVLGKSREIGVQLRMDDNPERFRPLEDLLCILCHELAHCSHAEHDLPFLRQWWNFMKEVEHDLGGKMRISRGANLCVPITTRKLKWLQWEDRAVANGQGGKSWDPSQKAIEAARNWERVYWDFHVTREEFYDIRVQEHIETSFDRHLEKQLAETSNPEMMMKYCTPKYKATWVARAKKVCLHDRKRKQERKLE
jgi:hypothetical protein